MNEKKSEQSQSFLCELEEIWSIWKLKDSYTVKQASMFEQDPLFHWVQAFFNKMQSKGISSGSILVYY